MIFKCFLFLHVLARVAFGRMRVCNEESERDMHPVLCSMVDKLIEDPHSVSLEIHDWAKRHNALVDVDYEEASIAVERLLRGTGGGGTPVVMAHGMGDSCFNDGMKGITKHISTLLGGNYATCIPTGDSQQEDTNNGYFLNMDASVEVFAQKVRSDPALANGFQAMGFSQGNNVIRGYIAKHNDPPVKTFISVNGVNAGEGAVPYCRPSTRRNLSFPSMCDLLMEQASRAAYTNYAQEHSFQANYWRDPRKSEFPTYQQYGQLAKWNNEGIGGVNETLKENWAKTDKFVWVLAKQDGMVWPKEGEQRGAPDPEDPFNKILPREETPWFKEDLFGLRTAEDAGKNMYESFDGDHLRFSMQDLEGWVEKYFTS